MRDPLTGLLNRPAFHERINEEVDRSRRYGASFSLLIIDVDHFKDINDTLGHGVTFERLFDTADQALLRAKESGRNQVADPIPAPEP